MWESLSCLLTLLESFDRDNPEMGTDNVARKKHPSLLSLRTTGST